MFLNYSFQSNLDENGLQEVNDQAQVMQDAIDAGDWVQATEEWRQLEYLIWDLTNRIDFYNILLYIPSNSLDSAAKCPAGVDRMLTCSVIVKTIMYEVNL